MRPWRAGVDYQDQFVEGQWSESERQPHRNIPKMDVVIRAVKHFHTLLLGKTIMTRSDYVSVAMHIYKQGEWGL